MSALPADSGFGCLLRSISRSQDVIAAATVYRARVGQRRAYLSQGDADAYTQAVLNHPRTPEDPVQNSPAWDGYFDAEEMARENDEHRLRMADARRSE